LAVAHALVIVAIPFFSWSALAVCLIGLFAVTPLGVNLGFHRLLTHRGLKVPKWLEYSLATLGAALGGGPPMHWVAEHRLHHRFSDTPQDPHSSREGFWHAHVAHLFYHKDFEDIEEQWMRYVPDMAGDRYYRFLNKYWIAFAAATLVPLYFWGGVSFVLWGGFVRIVLMLHITWFVNSASHLWGYKNYETDDDSRNCWWVGLLAAGEGWHNNHHAQPVSAAHGHRWWELDTTYLWVCLLERLGLARDVKRPVLAEAAPVAAETTP
jgi:stearoyl-CoA desaturase (delta-9 desaturase)